MKLLYKYRDDEGKSKMKKITERKIIKGSNIGVVEMDLHRGKKIKMSSFLIPRTSHTVIYHVTRIVF